MRGMWAATSIRPDDREAGGIHDGFDAGAAHAGASAAEELRVRPEVAKLIDQQGGVEIAGGFAGGYQDVAGHLRPV